MLIDFIRKKSSSFIFLSTLHFSLDIDECKKQPYLCGSNGECINLPGGYFCRCNKGYRFVADKGTCKGKQNSHFQNLYYRFCLSVCY